MYMKIRTDIQKSGQILEKKFFKIFFLDYDLWQNRKRLITKIGIGYEGRHIAQTKEHKKSFQKMKKYRGGGGGRNMVKFRFEVF